MHSMDGNGKQPPKRKKPPFQGVLVLFVAVLTLFFASFGVIKLLGGNLDVQVTAPSGVNSGSLGAASTPDTTGQTNLPAWDFVGPVEQSINTMGFVQPDAKMIALPANGRVDVSYFNTVTFVGDSISQGLFSYENILPGASHNATYKNIGPQGIYEGSLWSIGGDNPKEVPIDSIVASQPDNLYVLLGTNTMVSSSDDALIAYYKEMLSNLRARLNPAVGIYIQSITPVRPDNRNGFTMERINLLNSRLAQLAYEEGYYFVNISEALVGDDGYLREEYSGADGVHLHPDGYRAWVEYLITHTAYHPRNVYLPGSPYYREPA